MLFQRIVWVLWPSFLVAGVAEAVFFTLFDPLDLPLPGKFDELSRTAIYSFGFFGFWLVGIFSSGLTVFLEQSPWEVNRCPMPVSERPDECRKDCA